jgi:hypothetical protein
MSRKDMLARIYLFSLEDQMQDVAPAQQQLVLWEKALGKVFKPLKLTQSGTSVLAKEWLRNRLTYGRILGVAKDHIRKVPYLGYEHHDQEAPKLDDILNVCLADELAKDQLDLDAHDLIQSLVVFKIVNPYPNRRFLVNPHHLVRAPETVAVVIYDIEPTRHSGQSLVLRPRYQCEHLDISFWTSCQFPSLVQNMWAFLDTQFGCKLTLTNTAMRCLCPSDSPVPLPSLPKADAMLTIADTGDMVASHATPAYQLVADLFKSESFAEQNKFMQDPNIKGW